ncbi:MAG TPA: GNAT family N-acetyltransferase [Candidatus Limnocylindria bacterium]|nr:GNAT family N-acetyltransferase [Candidatus Limnocylindria bacterium]
MEDAAFAADMYTALYPDDPQDPVRYEHFWREPDSTAVMERFIAERDGERVGYGYQRHTKWDRTPERYGGIGADLVPEHRTPERLEALTAAMEERSAAEGARTITTYCWERDAVRLAMLERRGFREERRQRFWELDLRANRERIRGMTEESRARMRDQGIAVMSIDRDGDPEKWRKLWRMSVEAEQDIPTTVPITETPFDDFMKWMRSPGAHEDRIWIAREGDRILGVSMLSYPTGRGMVQTDWTGVARDGRGRGVARALKCETVTQALALGVDRVRTDNDGENAPILHINETMGYRRLPDMIQLLKTAPPA